MENDNSITCERIKLWADPATNIESTQREIAGEICKYSDGSYPVLDKSIKEAFISYICSLPKSNDHQLFSLNLHLLRIILRDKASPDMDCYLPMIKLLLPMAGLDENEQTKESTTEHLMTLEAEKCLVNLLFNSAKARDIFQKTPFTKLLSRISIVNCILSGGNCEDEKTNYLKGWNIPELEELHLYDLKIAFVVTAQVRELQVDCINDTDKTEIFQKVLGISLAQLEEQQDTKIFPTLMPWKYLNEALKILFNFYHKAKMFDLDMAQQSAIECAQILQNPGMDTESKQNAVNLLAVMPTTLPSLCQKLETHEKNIQSGPVQEGYDMRFVDALLRTFEQQIDQNEKEKQVTLNEHLSMFLTALNQLCTEHKAARRYCRLKVLPPLKAQDVERRPDVGADFRNKLVRLMTDNASRNGELAAEFLFILCKRSVGRLVKYVGFGHSAGLLANYGFLGQAIGPKHQSDSEDSETEEYKKVEEMINPVTGHIPPPGQLEELKRQLDSMSDEQKEYEVMKLVEAMDKLVDQGMIAPGTIGEDGRPRQVKHVAELIKDVKEEKEGNDTDDD